jgi:hypothetical protein
MRLDGEYPALGALAVDLRSRVQLALANEDLMPSSAAFARTMGEVLARGRARRTEFLRYVGGRSRQRELHTTLGYSSSKLARILGFGEVITDLSVAAIAMTRGARSAVLKLGAMANLIVSVYDQLVDAHGGRGVLPRGLLIRLLDGENGLGIDAERTPAMYNVVRNAVVLYSRMLQSLPHGHGRLSGRQQLTSTIVELYDIEAAVTDKGALSHEIMGLPAWLVTDSLDEAAMTRHRKWLRSSLGELHAWIDDVLDLEEDAKNGFPNRAIIRLRAARYRESEMAVQLLAEEIARLGRQVRRRRTESPTGVADRRALNQYKTIICSWVGGLRYHAI